VYDKLYARLPALPNRNRIQPIRACEALTLLQSEAPFELLERAPKVPQLRRDLVLAVSQGDVDRETEAADAFLRDYANCEAPLRPVGADTQYEPIEFHLDAPGFPAWAGFCRLSAGIGIMLGQWRPLQLNSEDEPFSFTA